MIHVMYRCALPAMVGAVVGVMFAMTSSIVLAQTDKPDCQCRAPGGDMVDLGTVQCVDIAGRSKLVLCTMSTNTPFWKDVEAVAGCPAA